MLKAGGASQGVHECRGVVPAFVARTEEWSPVDALACILFYIRVSVLPGYTCAVWNDGRRAGMGVCVRWFLCDTHESQGL